MIDVHTEWYREADVGRAILDSDCQAPKDIVVVTKVHPRSYQIDAMRDSLEQSQLDLFGKQRKLDVVLLHAPFCWEGHCNTDQTQFLSKHGWQAAWRNLEQMHDEGLVSAIGVSNFQPHQLKELLSFANKRVAVVQNFMVILL
jgi:diketogulonate reductase-like aldo/keto reductase